MDLKTYLSEKRGRQSELAQAIGAHAPDVSRWADGERAIPVHYGAPIELATGGLVTRKEMFPDSWQTIWPELVEQAPDHEKQEATRHADEEHREAASREMRLAPNLPEPSKPQAPGSNDHGKAAA